MLSILRRAQCRRLDDFELRKWLRQLSIPRRVSLTVFFILFLLYFIISSLTSSPYVSESQKCLNERLNAWKVFENENSVAIYNKRFGFTGNGFIGMGGDGELRLKTSRVLSIRSAFSPIIDTKIQDSESFAESYINDYRDGTIITLRCYRVVLFLWDLLYQYIFFANRLLQKDQCICTTQRVYAHRMRPHLLVQELQATNPSSSDVEIDLSVKISEYWAQTKSSSLFNPVYTRYFESDGAHTLAAVTCTKIPATVTIEEKHEIFLRFFCLINYISPLPIGKNKNNELKLLGESITKEFKNYSLLDGNLLYREHSTAWEKLNTITFGISKSLAPNALNADEINTTRYILLSNMRDPLLELGSSKEQKEAAATSMKVIDMCYTGHSTLLIPSRLWRKSDNINEVIETVDIWLLTLEKRGCSGLLKAGASGLAEAFVLSLLASKFSPEHLEVDIDPADLLREITVENLIYPPDVRVSISILLSIGNQPYFMISSDSQVFACDAACLNHPIAIGRSSVHIPVKVTKPATPILYISHDKNHLEQLRGTIHVVEVMDAPAHEHGLIALHRHGHRLGGLPMVVWLILGILMVVFHLFLFKLLYSEWRKGDTMPYNFYLRQRYLRSH
uniref:GPI inositol-deacylase n=1 Tax=Elaeophora elaphi TaxID=1147741 RepID=A0A0R3S6M0_9BILA